MKRYPHSLCPEEVDCFDRGRKSCCFRQGKWAAIKSIRWLVFAIYFGLIVLLLLTLLSPPSFLPPSFIFLFYLSTFPPSFPREG